MIYLVGAGPGDAELLTLKAFRILQKADVVIYDRLCGSGVLSFIPPSAKKIYAGKETGNHSLSQKEIIDLLLEYGKSNNTVVRLKGGDPFLFGRGGEEAEELSKNNIPYEVIPGVSSAIAVPECAGIPLTHRDYSSSVTIVSAHGRAMCNSREFAHGKNNAENINYDVLVKNRGTIVFLMGSSKIEHIASSLINAGLDKNTPAAIIQNGTTAKQKEVIATLATLESAAKKENISSPAVIVVGDVCKLSSLSTHKVLALRNIKIAVTRPRERLPSLANLLREKGAEVVEIPTIQIKKIANTPLLRQVLSDLNNANSNDKRWFVFTSPAGIKIFFEKLSEYKIDVRSLYQCRFAVIGNVSAATLESYGIFPDIVPEKWSVATLAEKLIANVKKDETVIIPRSSIGSKLLTKKLDEANINYIDIPIYNTVPMECYENEEYRDALGRDINWIAFTSESTVDCFVKIFGSEKTACLIRDGVKALCIGEQCAKQAQRYGFTTVSAPVASIESMVEALLSAQFLPTQLSFFSIYDRMNA